MTIKHSYTKQYFMPTRSKQTTLPQSTFANTSTTDSHQKTSLACARKTRTLPSLPSPSKSHGKLHGSGKTLFNPSPMATQQSKTTKTANYLQKRKRERPPQPPPHRQCGWHLRYTIYTTHPMNPDLDAVLTGTFEITSHSTSLDLVLLHAPNGRLISPIFKARLQQLINMYHS